LSSIAAEHARALPKFPARNGWGFIAAGVCLLALFSVVALRPLAGPAPAHDGAVAGGLSVTPKLAELVLIPQRIKVSSLFDRKMVVRVRCSVGCFVASTLKLDAKTSRKLRLTRRKNHSVRVAIGEAERLSAGLVRVTLRLSRPMIKRVRKARSGTLALRVDATDDAERRETLRAKIKLRR